MQIFVYGENKIPVIIFIIIAEKTTTLFLFNINYFL